MTSIHSFLMSLLVGLPVISLLIIVHEFGHFIVAKACNVGVIKFAIGFGPAIFRKRFGETEYQLSPILLGGFVRMVGDMPDPITGEQVTDKTVRNEAKEDIALEKGKIPAEVQKMLDDKSRWFIEKGFWAKSSVVVAGPLFNFLLAIALVACALLFYGEERPVDGAAIGNIQENSPAAVSGLVAGDKVTAINGELIGTWDDLANKIREGGGKELSLDIERGEKVIQARVMPKKRVVPGADAADKDVFLIGVERKFERHDVSLGRSVVLGTKWSFAIVSRTYQGLYGMVRGAVSPKELAGPLFIFGAAKTQASKGLEDLIYFTALLSVSLAVLNLLPIPILDGGHLLFFIVEAVLGPISVKKKEFAQGIGFAVLLMLMLFAIGNDITREAPTAEKPITWDSAQP